MCRLKSSKCPSEGTVQARVLRAYADEAFVTTLENRITYLPIQDEGESAETNGPDIEPDPVESEDDSQEEVTSSDEFVFHWHR
jgi:hypothetical protein